MTFTISESFMRELIMCRSVLAALADKDIHNTELFKSAVNDWFKKNAYSNMKEAVDLQIVKLMLSEIKSREAMR